MKKELKTNIIKRPFVLRSPDLGESRGEAGPVRRYPSADGEGGFTLVELMLVVVILGILASVVVVGFSGHTKRASINATRTSIGNICLAIDAYEVETGHFPSDLKQLTVATTERGPLIQSASIADSWGTDFQYNPNKGSFQYEVRSAGPDMQSGTEDDITN